MGSQNAKKTNNDAISAATGGFVAVGNVKGGGSEVKVPKPTVKKEEAEVKPEPKPGFAKAGPGFKDVPPSNSYSKADRDKAIADSTVKDKELEDELNGN